MKFASDTPALRLLGSDKEPGISAEGFHGAFELDNVSRGFLQDLIARLLRTSGANSFSDRMQPDYEAACHGPFNSPLNKRITLSGHQMHRLLCVRRKDRRTLRGRRLKPEDKRPIELILYLCPDLSYVLQSFRIIRSIRGRSRLAQPFATSL